MRTLLPITLLTLAAVSPAALYNVNTTLSPANENPPVMGSSATGIVTGTYDDATNQLILNVTATDFTSNTNNAHLHGFALPSANAGVRFGFPAANLGSTSYSLLGFLINIPEADEANYIAGLSYVNLHTTLNSGGEVRGNLAFTPVPEPASMAVLGLGLAALKRRRKG